MKIFHVLRSFMDDVRTILDPFEPFCSESTIEIQVRSSLLNRAIHNLRLPSNYLWYYLYHMVLHLIEPFHVFTYSACNQNKSIFTIVINCFNRSNGDSATVDRTKIISFVQIKTE